MYRSLIVNTAISAAAYFAISAVGIVIVGWLVGAYGLEAYGVITLARLFLPTGLAGILDLGAPDNASHAVATARGTGNWSMAGSMLIGLVVIVFATSLIPCAALLLAAHTITELFDLQPTDAAAFAHALDYAALSLPFLLVGLIAEGAIRGFERYGMARSIEVSISLAYGVGCYIYIHYGLSHVAIIYLGILLAIARALLAVVLCIWCLWPTGMRFADWRSVGLARAWERTKVTGPTKILSTLQTQTQPFLIGTFLGPSSAAIYDVLTRLPRFVKAAMGLLNSAVLPFTSRLEAAEKNVTRVAENGILVIAILAAPPLFAAASFSQPILGLWVGKGLTNFWPWQAIGFIVPLLTVVLGFGFNSLFSRIHVNRMAYQFVIARIVVQYLIAFALISTLAERAFVLGGVVAVIATAFWEFRLILREHAIGKTLVKQLLSLIAIGAALTTIALPFAATIHSVLVLIAALGVYSLVFWAIAWVAVMPAHTKKALINHSF